MRSFVSLYTFNEMFGMVPICQGYGNPLNIVSIAKRLWWSVQNGNLTGMKLSTVVTNVGKRQKAEKQLWSANETLSSLLIFVDC